MLLGGSAGGLVGYHLLKPEDREELEAFAEDILRTHLGSEQSADQNRRRRVKRMAEQISHHKFGKPVKDLTAREVRTLKSLVMAQLDVEDS
jgi:hypothetical protein